MRFFTTLVLIAGLGLAGCATVPGAVSIPAGHGNFTALPLVSVQKLVGDAGAKLRVLYPAASTQFELQQATHDAFDTSLVESLRASGYAVLEAVPILPNALPITQLPKPAEPGPVVSSPSTAGGLTLRYIVDAPADLSLYRVQLLVGDSSLSRAYRVAPDSTLHPAGAWVRKE